MACWDLALLCALDGRIDEARGRFDEARRVLTEQGSETLLIVVDFNEAEMNCRLGGAEELARARVLLERARLAAPIRPSRLGSPASTNCRQNSVSDTRTPRPPNVRSDDAADPSAHLPAVRGDVRARDPRRRTSRSTLIRGDRDDVWSKGYLCPKGTTLGHLHHDPDRLRAPMVRDGDQWREVDVGRGVRALRGAARTA